MLTTTLAIRAVLALLLSVASLTAFLRDPAAAVPAPTDAVASPAETRNDARHAATVDFDFAYAVNDASAYSARVCR